MTRNFEVFAGKFKPAPNLFHVTVSKRGIIGFNHAVFIALGSPDCVLLLFDYSTNAAGLRKAECAEPYTYPVFRLPLGNSYRIHAHAFCRSYGLSSENGLLVYSPTLENDILVLQKESAVIGYTRKRHAGSQETK